MMTPAEPRATDACLFPQELADWYRHWPGELVSKAECKVLAELISHWFGYQLVQLGSLGPGQDYLAQCPIRQHTVIGLCGSGDKVQLCARAEQLPIASDSVDGVLLPHTLDFADDPHQVLREAERILIPEGRLLITAFNPWSLWGLWRLLRRPLSRGRRQLPWCGHFLSYPRLQDWLTLMGFDIEQTEVRVFRPPLRQMAALKRLAFMEPLGERYLPMLAGVYVVQAVKRVSMVRPVGAVWKRAPALGRRIIEPSTRGMTQGAKRG
jgi:SAM-dependent methyltransferase